MAYKDILKFWIFYPAIAGICVGIGHFITYWCSIYLLKMPIFRKSMSFVGIDIEST